MSDSGPTDDYLPLSGLQHFSYCPRQFALIHIEQSWIDNGLTAEGRRLHDRVDHGGPDVRRGVRTERGVALVSNAHRLTGKMDVLEIEESAEGRPIQLFPIEYKRGKPKIESWDRIQLCAQALCLEEMRGVSITEGAIWYWQVRHRVRVAIDEKLRQETLEVITGARALYESRATPRPVNDWRCKSCSLHNLCTPTAFDRDRTSEYLEALWNSEEVAPRSGTE